MAGVAQNVGFGVGLVLAEIQQRSDGIKGRVMRGRIIALENLVEPFGRLILEARGAIDLFGQKVVRFRPGNQQIPDLDHGILAGAMESLALVQIVQQLDDVIAPLAPGVGFQRL